MTRKELINTAKSCSSGCSCTGCPLYYVEGCKSTLIHALVEELEKTTLIIKVKKNEK